MQLIIVRHAIAMDREEFAVTNKDDDLRPLTPDGRRRWKEGSKGLRRLIDRPDLIATSPLTRAVQTAEILASALEMKVGETTDVLKPDAKYPALEQWLRKRDPEECVAIVGHEPHLSGLVSWLLTGGPTACIELKKGGACLLSFEGVPHHGKATLEWLVTPRQLRG